MLRLKLLSGAAIAGIVLAAGSVQAADMPVYEPEIIATGGWYLRGDIGITFQQVEDVEYLPGPTTFVDEIEFDPSWFIGAGIGYKFSKWFRVDLTGEYRGASDLEGSDEFVVGDPPEVGTNDYTGEKEEWLVMANGYLDFELGGGFTPFIGAGVGAVNISINDFEDVGGGVATGSFGFAPDSDEWNFAWALHAGIGYALSERLTLEVAYRFLHLGDFETADLEDETGDPLDPNSVSFEDIYSHDVKFGLRYTY